MVIFILVVSGVMTLHPESRDTLERDVGRQTEANRRPLLLCACSLLGGDEMWAADAGL